jgi:hypothetical protein
MRRFRLALVALGLLVYLAGFLVSHIEEGDSQDGLWNLIFAVSLVMPLAGVAAAAVEWPRWRLVAAVTALFFLLPLAVDRFEESARWYPAEVSAEDYAQQGMDHLTTSFLSVLAFPVLVVAALAAVLRRLWLRRTRPAGFEPATSASGGQRSIH